MTNLENYELESKNHELTAITPVDTEIIDALKFAIKEVTESLENFQLHAAANEIYHFTWHSFADVYIEASKAQLANKKTKENTQKILLHLLINVLKLLHPFMPFITEHIWGILKEKDLVKSEMLMIENWPK